MIPVLGVPVLNRPDLLAACLASIDEPIGRLVVIDNSPTGEMREVAEDHAPPGVDLFVTEPPANLGYAASLNLVIRSHPHAPWWAIANADVTFGPGDLARLAAEMAQGGARWVGVIDWRVHGIAAETVERIGFWDENYHPAYVDDCDYERRCDLAGIPRYFLDGTTTHVGSVCLEDHRRDNARSYPANLAYHAAKWGGPPRGGERFASPFDAGGSLAGWQLDLRRLRHNDWH